MALHKLVGDTIHKGDIIADYKGFFGIREYISEHTGTITEINHQEGSITINIHSDSTNTMFCFFKGEVSEITEDVISLKVKEGKEFPVENVSHFFGGPTFYYHEETIMKASEDTIMNRIITASEIPSYDQVKMEALGARAFITLHGLKDKTNLPIARISTINDFEKILKHNYPYCLIGSDNSSIIYYK
jgi:hypothetical protein